MRSVPIDFTLIKQTSSLFKTLLSKIWHSFLTIAFCTYLASFLPYIALFHKRKKDLGLREVLNILFKNIHSSNISIAQLKPASHKKSLGLCYQ